MKILLLLLTLLHTNLIIAQTLIGTEFNYQGELLDNGLPANGDYDFILTPFNTEFDGLPIDTIINHFLNIPVNNGLFNIPNVDFGSVAYEGGREVWIEIEIKKSSDFEFEFLSSRQKIGAVPFSVKSVFADGATLAFNLTANGASPGDILAFDGTEFNWAPKIPNWIEQNNILSTSNVFSDHQVSIGTSSPVSAAKLTISTSEDGMVTQFDGSGDMYNEYSEAGASVGYVGSVVDGSLHPGTTSNDFEIGTTTLNTSGKLHLTITGTPKLTVAESGNIGINNTNPNAILDVFIESNDDTKPMRIVKDGEIFGIHANSGVSIGDATVPPISGLHLRGDAKQDLQANGMMKYMLNVSCNGNSSSIINSYNGVNNNPITIGGPSSGPGTGMCFIVFPTEVNNRFFQASTSSSFANLTVNCLWVPGDNTVLGCRTQSNGTDINSELMVLIY